MTAPDEGNAPPAEVADTQPGDAPGMRLARGVCAGLAERGLACMTEVPTRDGLRMDVCALARDGEVWCVEIKSSRADFTADSKWSGYLSWCDRFLFAVPEGFPEAILPSAHGLIRADAHGCEIVRPAARAPLPPARRKAVTLAFARLAADRLGRRAAHP